MKIDLIKLQLWIYVVAKYVVITVFLGFLLLSHVYARVLGSFLEDREWTWNISLLQTFIYMYIYTYICFICYML